MHLIQFREILRDAEVAYAIHPIVRKYLLAAEDTTKALIACGVPRAANVAQIATGRLLNIDLPSLQNVQAQRNIDLQICPNKNTSMTSVAVARFQSGPGRDRKVLLRSSANN